MILAIVDQGRNTRSATENKTSSFAKEIVMIPQTRILANAIIREENNSSAFDFECLSRCLQDRITEVVPLAVINNGLEAVKIFLKENEIS